MTDNLFCAIIDDMKKVLIADSHPLFRDFLKNKLSEDQVEVIVSQEIRDLYTKMITTLPNLIILDMGSDYAAEYAFLQNKIQDSNAASIPVIITGPTQEKSSIAALTKFGVIKYFAKPIQFDVFFASIGKVLNIPLSMDTTPCILDLHRNGNIIFVEIAAGLNRDKIALLQFKLSEMIMKEEIEYPKIIIMLTSLELSFVDGYNLEFLIDNVRYCPKVHNKNIKILSLSPYVKELLDGHNEYSEIEMSDNLPKLLNSLVDTTAGRNLSDLITDRILTPTFVNETNNPVDTRFAFESQTEETKKTQGTMLNMAIVDSDETVLRQTMAIFSSKGARCEGFKGGQDFLSSYQNNKYDMIILDVFLSDKTGLSLLERLRAKNNTTPVVIYSQNMTKEIFQKVMSYGPRSILVKPLKPDVLVQKCLGVLED